MSTTTFKQDLVLFFDLLMTWVFGVAAAGVLERFGLHGEWVFSMTYMLAVVASIALRKHSRQNVVRLVSSARGRVVQLGRSIRVRYEKRSRIVRAPAARLDRIAQLLWSKPTYERVFKPARADVVHEWQRAEARGDHKRVRMLRYFHGPVSMLQHMAAQVPVSVIKFLIDLWKKQ